MTTSDGHPCVRLGLSIEYMPRRGKQHSTGDDFCWGSCVMEFLKYSCPINHTEQEYFGSIPTLLSPYRPGPPQGPHLQDPKIANINN
jgi:hypothetical protein